MNKPQLEEIISTVVEMSNKNTDSMNSQQGEFHMKVPPSKPMKTSGHAPGIMVSNDAYPEFHAEQYPAGTAPKEHTFYPQGPGENAAYSAGDTLGGSSSADVHTDMGHPGSEQTSGGQRKREGAGLEGIGANASDPMMDQGLGRDHQQGPKRGELGSATGQEPSRTG